VSFIFVLRSWEGKRGGHRLTPTALAPISPHVGLAVHAVPRMQTPETEDRAPGNPLLRALHTADRPLAHVLGGRGPSTPRADVTSRISFVEVGRLRMVVGRRLGLCAVPRGGNLVVFGLEWGSEGTGTG